MFALLGKSIFFLFLRTLCAENGKCFLEIKWQTLNFEQKNRRHFHLESNYNWRWRVTKLDTDLHWNREQMVQMGFKVSPLSRLTPAPSSGHNDIASSWINSEQSLLVEFWELSLIGSEDGGWRRCRGRKYYYVFSTRLVEDQDSGDWDGIFSDKSETHSNFLSKTKKTSFHFIGSERIWELLGTSSILI